METSLFVNWLLDIAQWIFWVFLMMQNLERKGGK